MTTTQSYLFEKQTLVRKISDRQHELAIEHQQIELAAQQQHNAAVQVWESRQKTYHVWGRPVYNRALRDWQSRRTTFIGRLRQPKQPELTGLVRIYHIPSLELINWLDRYPYATKISQMDVIRDGFADIIVAKPANWGINPPKLKDFYPKRIKEIDNELVDLAVFTRQLHEARHLVMLTPEQVTFFGLNPEDAVTHIVDMTNM